MRKLSIVVAAFVAVLGATTNAPGKSRSSCTKDSLALVNAGILTVGTDNPAYPPWFAGGSPKGSKWKINDPHTGKGYESAVAYGAAKRLGFSRAEVEWVVVPFSKSFAPGKKPFDFYMAQVSYKPARAKNVSFSASYYNVNQAVVALKGKPIAKVTTVAGLKPFTLGVAIGTTSYDYVVKYVKPSAKPKVFDTPNDAITALKNGQVDGIVTDFPSTGYITAVQVPNSVVVGRLPTKGAQEYFGLVFQKGSTLVPCVNTALSKMRSDGTLKRFEQQWLSKAGGAPILK